MSREIKFRIWQHHKGNSDTGWMTYLELNPITRELDYLSSSLLEQTLETEKRRNFVKEGNVDFAIMQFTGLCDKNGKEIYEGDIFGNLPQLRCVVKRENDGAYKLHYLDKRIESISILDHKILKSEVIGDIHSTPELLKEVEE